MLGLGPHAAQAGVVCGNQIDSSRLRRLLLEKKLEEASAVQPNRIRENGIFRNSWRRVDHYPLAVQVAFAALVISICA